jgi:hypothetical protein
MHSELGKGVCNCCNLSPMLIPTITTTVDCAKYPRVMMSTLGLSIFTMSSHGHSQNWYRPPSYSQCNSVWLNTKPALEKMHAEVHETPYRVQLASLHTSSPSSKPYASQLWENEVSYSVHVSQRSLDRLQSSSIPAVKTAITSDTSKDTLVRNAIRNNRLLCPEIFCRVSRPMFVRAFRPSLFWIDPIFNHDNMDRTMMPAPLQRRCMRSNNHSSTILENRMLHLTTRGKTCLHMEDLARSFMCFCFIVYVGFDVTCRGTYMSAERR